MGREIYLEYCSSVSYTHLAVFSGTPYPASLLEAVMLRIRAERSITWGRAAILKAYYLKNPHADCPEEVLTVGLNETSTNPDVYKRQSKRWRS